MCKRTVVPILMDKIFLLFVSIIVLFSYVGFLFFLSEHLDLSDEWVMFIGLGCVGYLLLTLSGAFEFTFKKYKMSIISLLILFLIIFTMMTGAFLIFYLGFLPLPKYAIPYVIGMTILSTGTILVLEFFLELIGKKK